MLLRKECRDLYSRGRISQLSTYVPKVVDFGLARIKQTEASLMNSAVGSMQYSCPEVVRNECYGPNIDIWGAGCILYVMAMLKPPFGERNPFALIKQICGGVYPTMSGGYSELMITTVKLCLQVEGAVRPDIDALSSHIGPVLMSEFDRLDSSVSAKDGELQRAQMLRRRYRSESATHQKTIQVMRGQRLDSNESSRSLWRQASSSRYSNGFQAVPENRLLSPTDSIGSQISDLNLSWAGLSMNSVFDTKDREGISRAEPRDELTSPSRTDQRPSLQSAYAPSGPRPTASPQRPSSGQRPHSRGAASSGIASGGSPSGHSRPVRPSSGARPSSAGARPGRMSSHTRRGAENRDVESPGSSRQMSSWIRRGTEGCDTESPVRSRHPSVKLSASQVRRIPDPVMSLLHQLHKLVYVTQLPSTPSAPTADRLSFQRARLVIDRYKRALFSPRSTLPNLKLELKLLSEGSEKVVPLDFSALSESSFWNIDVRSIRSTSATIDPADDINQRENSMSSPPRPDWKPDRARSATYRSEILDTVWDQTSLTYGTRCKPWCTRHRNTLWLRGSLQ